MESFEQQYSSAVAQDYSLPNHNNTQTVYSYDWSQDQPIQMNEDSHNGNLPDEFWLVGNLWYQETSWIPQNPGTANEEFRELASGASHLISDADNHDSQMDALQVPDSTIKSPNPMVSLTVNNSYACERCSRTFPKMYLLRYAPPCATHRRNANRLTSRTQPS